MVRAIGTSLVLALLAACDASVSTGSGGSGGEATGGAATGGAPSVGVLGLNDVSMLVPLPANNDPTLFRASDLASDGEPFLPKARYTQAVTIPNRPDELGDFYDDLQIAAWRFDLCDRHAPGPCEVGGDAVFRIVYQPIVGGQAFDLGFHAFYSIPAAEVPVVIDALRALAASAPVSVGSPLGESVRITEHASYRKDVQALLSRYAVGSKLIRLTAMGQSVVAAALRWVFHGIELKDGEFVSITVPGADVTTQDVLLLANASYQLTPAIDEPVGMLLALSEPNFAAASPMEQKAALEALVDTDNPLTHTADTVQCAACHVSTAVLPRRAMTAGVAPASIEGIFESPYEASVAEGESAIDDGIIRGFGWRNNAAAISQRVVNESAQVLIELEARFPSP